MAQVQDPYDVTIDPEAAALLEEQDQAKDAAQAFAVVFTILQVIITILYFTCTDYGAFAPGKPNSVFLFYTGFTNVSFMIFIGFGFLMTFLRRYSFSAVGLNMLISCFVFEWGLLVMAFFHQASVGQFHVVHVGITDLIEGCFAAGAVMISFGALLGKVSPLQMLLISFLEVIVYALNFFVGSHTLKALDMGGSIFVHTFGAYFGLACAWAMRPPRPEGSNGPLAHQFNGSRTTSDMTAMIGTIFLWVLWPSFNGALAPPTVQFRVVINTVLALVASAIATFVFSRLFSHDYKFDMVHIQNATLAGGVAVGSSSDMVVGPGGAMTIGFVGGLLSVIGYRFIHPWLEQKIGLDDTCGVHNLHGLPGLLGGIGGGISIGVATQAAYGAAYTDFFSGAAPRSPAEQAGFQFAALALAVVISIVGGLLTGFFVKALTGCVPGIQDPGKEYPEGYFEDSKYWEVPHDYKKC